MASPWKHSAGRWTHADNGFVTIRRFPRTSPKAFYDAWYITGRTSFTKRFDDLAVAKEYGEALAVIFPLDFDNGARP